MFSNMSKKVALITGVTGQDGSLLANFLLRKNYKVYGIIRRNSVIEHQKSRLDHLDNKINVSYGDLLNESSLHNLKY